MLLQDIFDELTYGELSQLAIGGREAADGTPTDTPEIRESDRPGIIRHINTALTALYTRFRLKEKTVLVQLIDDKAMYVMDKAFAITNTASDAEIKYLIDSVDDPFDNSLIKIEHVSAQRDQLGLPEDKRQPWVPLPLNKIEDPLSCRTPSMRTLLVPQFLTYDDRRPNQLKVLYRANHPPIDVLDGIHAAMITEIELPVTHLQALLYYVASRILNPTGMVEEFHSGNSYYAKYESECARLEHENMEIDESIENTNFQRQGFV